MQMQVELIKNYINKLFKPLFLVTLLLCLFSCKRVKTTPTVNETYADGKPKRVTEYIVDEHGAQQLYKETYYFPEEKKYVEGNYDKEERRDGIWTSWYENGNKNSEVRYINGKEDGKYRVWHPNGKLYIKGKYEMGCKVGTWEIYDSLGVKTKEMKF